MVKNLRELGFSILWILVGVGSIVGLWMINMILIFTPSTTSNYTLTVLLPTLVRLSFVLLIVPVKSVLLNRVLGLKTGNWSIATVAGMLFGILLSIAYGYLLQLLYPYYHSSNLIRFEFIASSMYFIFRICVIRVQARNNRNLLGKHWVTINVLSVCLVIACYSAFQLSWHFSPWFLIFGLIASEFVNAYSYIWLAREQAIPMKKKNKA